MSEIGGHDGLEVRDDEDRQTDHWVVLLAGDRSESLVYEDGNDAGQGEDDGHHHAGLVHPEPDVSSVQLLALKKWQFLCRNQLHSIIISQFSNIILLTMKISLQYLAQNVPRLAQNIQARTMKLA